jgi:uncharacterized membrane protein
MKGHCQQATIYFLTFSYFSKRIFMYDIAKLLHLISAIVWMGGMTFMLFALRPAATALMQPQPRAQLIAEVWRRFFAIVAVAAVVLFATGTHLYTAASKAGGGISYLPLGWHVMLVIGMLMILIFGHIYFAGFRKFKRAVAAAQWPVAAKAAGQIQTLVTVNFILGWLAIAAVRLVR